MKKVSLIIFYNEKNEVIIQDRRSISKYGEKWGFFGGSIEEGENREQAIVREIKEELNFNLDKFEYLTCFSGNFQGKFDFNMDVFVRFIDFDLKEFTVLEGDGFLLCSINEAKKLLSEIDVKVLDFLDEYLILKKDDTRDLNPD